MDFKNPNIPKSEVKELISEKTFEDLKKKYDDFKNEPKAWRSDVSPFQLELENIPAVKDLKRQLRDIKTVIDLVPNKWSVQHEVQDANHDHIEENGYIWKFSYENNLFEHNGAYFIVTQ